MTMSKNATLCPICGEGHLSIQIDKNPVEYKGVRELLGSFYAVCDACGSEQADAAQTRANKRLMIAFKKRVDGLLTGAEVRALRERLGLTQEEAAKVFGGGPVAFSKYETDDVTQSKAMDQLLRLAAELPAAFDRLARWADIAKKHWQDANDWKVDTCDQAKAHRRKLHLVSCSKPSQQGKQYAA